MLPRSNRPIAESRSAARPTPRVRPRTWCSRRPVLSVITTAISEARKIFERMNSYVIYRISETIRVLLFMMLAILLFNFFPVTAVMIVLIAVLNYFPIMNDRLRQHHRGSTPRALGHGTRTYGQLGYRAVFGVFRFVQPVFVRGEIPSHGPAHRSEPDVPHPDVLPGTSPSTSTAERAGTFWQRPLPQSAPGGCLRIDLSARDALVEVYGWGYYEDAGMGKYAIAVWVYALVWFCPHRFG